MGSNAKKLTLAYEDGYTEAIEDFNEEIDIVVKKTNFMDVESLQNAVNHLILFGYHKYMEQLRKEKEEEEEVQITILFVTPE